MPPLASAVIVTMTRHVPWLWVVLFAAGTSQIAPRALSSADVVVAIGSEADADIIMPLVLRGAVASSERRVFVLASQMRPSWLPVITGVEFVRLTDSQVSDHLAACGHYWTVSDVKRERDVVTLWLGAVCRGTGLSYVISRDDGVWHLGPPGTNQNGRGWGPGIGSGFFGRPPYCPCVGR